MRDDASIERPLPATGWPYRTLVGVGLAVLTLSTTAFFRVPLLPAIGQELSMSAGQLGVITSMFAAGRLVTDLPAGQLLERVRSSALLTGSALLMALGSAVMAAAPGPTTVYIAAFMVGVSSAVTNGTGMHTFSVSVPARRRGTALAFYTTALLGGQALGPVLGGSLAAAGSWRVAQAAAAVAGLLVSLAMLWRTHQPHRARWSTRHAAPPPGRDDTPTTSRGAADGRHSAGHHASDDSHAATTGQRSGPAGADGRAARWALLAVAFAMFFTLGAVPQTLIPVIGAAALELDVATIGLALGAGGACRLVGGFIGGSIADRIARRAALVPGLLLQAVGVALVIGDGVAWWFSGIVVMSLASWSIAVGATVVADLSPAGNLGPRLGGFRFVGDIGLVVGPLLATRLFETLGRAPTMAAVAGLLVAAAAWVAVSVPETGEVRARQRDVPRRR